ncbi:uncharacterized protein LOC119661321 [Hermetia illucens]|uniref:uncharacterized protein LOC119661321 n=1 Tax=Hermetia illucens TaxID=343691 RepID=UPI0018CBFE29|nr:uncharacterized protein LOC119661321 [Hermetia illucens]
MFGKTARTLSNCDIFSAKQLEGEKDFSNWYANSMSRIEYLNNLITNDDTGWSLGGGDVVAHPENAVDDLSLCHTSEHHKRTNERLRALSLENEWMREIMRRASDFGNLQSMATEIRTLKAERNRLRNSLKKVVEVEDKIMEYKRQASMSQKYQVEVEKLRKELETVIEKFTQHAAENQSQISEMKLQLKITQKERDEYRNKAEKLQLRNDLLKFELEKLKFRKVSQAISQHSIALGS